MNYTILNRVVFTLERVSHLRANANAKFPSPLVVEVLHPDIRTPVSILISNSHGS